MDRIISEIKNTADKVVKKSGELVEMSKTKLNILNTKSSIDQNFKVLGELVYNSQKEDSDITSEKLEEVIKEIDALYEKLAQLDEAYANLGNKKICPNCKKANDSNASFCCNCGFDFAD